MGTVKNNSKTITIKNIFTIPNGIAYARLMMTCVGCWLIYSFQDKLMLVFIGTSLLVIALIFDRLDVYVAREYEVESSLGKKINYCVDTIIFYIVCIILFVFIFADLCGINLHIT